MRTTRSTKQHYTTFQSPYMVHYNTSRLSVAVVDLLIYATGIQRRSASVPASPAGFVQSSRTAYGTAKYRRGHGRQHWLHHVR